jgi:hypothetical protein
MKAWIPVRSLLRKCLPDFVAVKTLQTGLKYPADGRPKCQHTPVNNLCDNRYAEAPGQISNHVNPVLSLARMTLVPVVGLEPTRLFKAPGF